MSGSRASKGCAMCRKRKVRCDEGRPSCARCIKRGEVCEGYRDASATFIFKDETEKAALHSLQKSKRSSPQSSTSRSDQGGARIKTASSSSAAESPTQGDLKFEDGEEGLLSLGDLDLDGGGGGMPWLKNPPRSRVDREDEEEEEVVSRFFDKYVMYPCSANSTPGFLEQLPLLFEEVKMSGRVALRWAVRAVSYASLAASLGVDGVEGASKKEAVRRKADTCYGRSLAALGEMLASEDDEEMAIFQPKPDKYGAHTEGMAQILRLRSPDQLRTPRGWSLFRLSHHRLQRQQLAFPSHLAPLQTSEQESLLLALNEQVPECSIEKANFEIANVCRRAREIRARISPVSSEINGDEVVALVREMYDLETKSVSWRGGVNWGYKTIASSELVTYEGLPPTHADLNGYPDNVGLYPDLWIAYEINYQRTGRILLHTQILGCLASLTAQTGEVDESTMYSKNVISALVEQVLESVPQSLGDVSANGIILNLGTEELGKGEERRRRTNEIGAYFLLWSVKVIKSSPYASEEQRERARGVFERIRGVTGMEEVLGERSCV